MGSSPIPLGLAATGHPVSVCHQLSMTGLPSAAEAHS
jgi:hypothetical protein